MKSMIDQAFRRYGMTVTVEHGAETGETHGFVQPVTAVGGGGAGPPPRRSQQRPPTEDHDGRDQGGTQGDEHVAHDLPGRCAGTDMRGSGDHKLHLTASFFASSFSLCALRHAASFAFASLLVCTSGLCAGQPNEQQPHSMQRLTFSSASRSILPAS